MHCHICDKMMSSSEIQLAPDKSYEPCALCMEIILDTAYSDGFIRPDDLDDIETLDDDSNTTEIDDTDLWSFPEGEGDD